MINDLLFHGTLLLHVSSYIDSILYVTAASYTPFFKDCWDKKTDTESAFTFNDDTSLTSSQKNEKWILERLGNRPPVPLPDHANTNHVVRKESFTTFGKGSTSNRFVYIHYAQNLITLVVLNSQHKPRNMQMVKE